MLREAWASLRILRRARSSSRWPLARQRAHQEAALVALVRHAAEQVPLYQALFAEAGLEPERVRSLGDLARVPVLHKERLRRASRDQVLARGSDPRTLSEVRTSGSTGAPLGIWLGPFERAWQRAVAWRVLFEHGFRWTDRTLEIRRTAGPTSRLQALGLAPKDWASILDPPEHWARLLAARRHAAVVAGAGTLRALAEAWRGLGHAPPRPRIVVSDSETLEPRARAEVAAALGTEPVDVYGLVELSNFAWECEVRSGYHVSADSHLVEVDAPPGDVGPVVVTDLGMRTMPMLRYATGDFAAWATDPCPCGRTLPRLARIHGRAVDSVLLPDGRRLFWPFFHETLAAHAELRRWRVVQEAADRIRVELVPDASAEAAGASLCARVEREIRAVLPAGLEVVVTRCEAIPERPGEKTRMVVSRL